MLIVFFELLLQIVFMLGVFCSVACVLGGYDVSIYLLYIINCGQRGMGLI